MEQEHHSISFFLFHCFQHPDWLAVDVINEKKKKNFKQTHMKSHLNMCSTVMSAMETIDSFMNDVDHNQEMCNLKKFD